MAQRRRAPSSTPPRTTRKRPQSKSSGPQPLWSVARWLLRRARPRTASELLALVLVLVGVGTFLAAMGAAIYNNRTPGPEMFWCVAILLAAFASRLFPWWRAELRDLTPDRARSYAGSALVVFIALSLSWHMVSDTMGWGNAYLLMGPASQSPGALVVLGLVGVVAVALILDAPVGAWLSLAWSRSLAVVEATRDRQTVATRRVEDIILETPEDEAEPEPDPPSNEPETELPRLIPLRSRNEPAPVPFGDRGPVLPPIDIFVPAAKGPVAAPDLELKADRIQETLASFGVGARVVGHHHGPVVTQFDVQPDRGVKVKSITALQNDLALALAAPTIRIQAPVPGKPVVGIEIPNSAATMVSVRELLETEQFQSMKSPLGVVLGKDVAGAPAVIDLAKMPHLLIAGATGSGKSVCVNALISCLLFRNTPEQVRLLMIDPKMVELTVYNGVPHLLSPVVTQMDRVVGMLQWTIREMERRYQLFSENTVRNIQRYNEKMDAAGRQKLPYLVLVIDELADLMMVSPEDVEDAICRIAQLARAAGIHLVIATQRPSVDVVTGLIKANFPARIAFAMSSQVDSRTILDTAGAEKLLGRGDMLYQPPDAPRPVRLQGAYLTDHEIEGLVEFWKRSPLQQAVQRIAAEEFAAAEKAAAAVEDDLIDEAILAIRESQAASVSFLQRKLRIGYSRAARLMDQLENRGIVGPADGSKQRRVLDPDEHGTYDDERDS